MCKLLWRSIIFQLFLTIIAWGQEPSLYDEREFIDSEEELRSLLKYSLPSPVQQEIGASLYMSYTGLLEWWLAKLQDVPNQLGGEFDLSERFILNIAKKFGSDGQIANWRTDTIYLFNVYPYALRNEYYRFTQGWYKWDGEQNLYVSALVGEKNAKYGTNYNWIDHLDTLLLNPLDKNYRKLKYPMSKLPRWSREIIHVPKDGDQWSILTTPEDIVEKVLTQLQEHKTPIHVIYHHRGTWHAVNIIGYHKTLLFPGCPFVEGHITYANNQESKFTRLFEQETHADRKQLWDKYRQFYANQVKRIQAFIQHRGGCRQQGVFYVRDSLYEDTNGPIYDYDLSQEGEELAYSAPFIYREFEWLEVLSNHIVRVFVEH